MGKRKKNLRKAAGGPIVVGVGWYSPSQWARLREVSADPDQLEQTHQQWVATYERATRALAAKGVILKKVPIDVGELEKWCREREKPIDGSARSEYVLDIVQRDHATLDVISPGDSALR
jgi:hypothetical protein